MAGRLAIGVAVATCCLTTGSLYAQGYAPPGGPPPGMQAVAPNPYYGAAAYGQPAAFAPPLQPQDWSGGPQGCQPAQATTYDDCNNITQTTDLGTATCQFGETPLEQAISRVVRNVSVRLDYINWGIKAPGGTLIGAQPSTAGIFNDTTPFNRNPRVESPLVDPNNPPFLIGTTPVTALGGTMFGYAQAVDTSPISLASNSGIQGTLALPLTFGTAELTGFILQKSTGVVAPGGMPQGSPPDELFNEIPLRLNDQPSALALIYPNGIMASFTSFVFGAEGNFYFNPVFQSEHGNWTFGGMPMIGFRYLGIQEKFGVEGLNAQIGNTIINSNTISNIFGPQIGMRFELATHYFTLGVEPKIMLGLNEAASGLSSSDPTLGNNHDHSDYVEFAPVGALNVYTKIPIRENIRLYVAYNLLGTTNISRPQQQIDYNATQLVGGDPVNGIHLDVQRSSFMMQGYSAGVEINF